MPEFRTPSAPPCFTCSLAPESVVVLAGGLGTRLRSVLPDRPKPMADIDGIPFLELLLRDVALADPGQIILCVSFMKEVIQEHFGDNFLGIPVLYSEESEPLGTGGAIKQAFDLFHLDDALVLNGDSYVKVDYNKLLLSCRHDPLGLVLVHVEDANRYGRAEVADGRVLSLLEKSPEHTPGLVNAGVYKISRKLFSANLPRRFSFEKDVLEPDVRSLHPRFLTAEGYFIDIGIPESLALAQCELKERILGKPLHPALFLDRDGVICVDKRHVYKIEDCEFIDGIFDICRRAKAQGQLLVVITNQAGIAKGLYTMEDYFRFRDYVHAEFEKQDCPIDAEYFCPFHVDGMAPFRRRSFFRKPNPGMILAAARDLNIDLSRSSLIGDKESDLEAARRAGVSSCTLVGNDTLTPIKKGGDICTLL